MSCWEFPPRCVQLRVMMIDEGQAGATKENRLVGSWWWLTVKIPGVVGCFGYHPWNLVCLPELFQSVLALLCPLLSACGARRLGLVGHMLHGAAEMNRVAASWPIVWSIWSDGIPVDVLQTDCTCCRLCCRCGCCWGCCGPLRCPMRWCVVGQVDLDRCLGHDDEQADDGRDLAGGNKHGVGGSPTTGMRKSNDERFFYTGSFQVCLIHLCFFFFFFFDRFFFFLVFLGGLSASYSGRSNKAVFWNLVSLQVSMARFLGWFRPHHRPSIKGRFSKALIQKQKGNN